MALLLPLLLSNVFATTTNDSNSNATETNCTSPVVSVGDVHATSTFVSLGGGGLGGGNGDGDGGGGGGGGGGHRRPSSSLQQIYFDYFNQIVMNRAIELTLPHQVVISQMGQDVTVQLSNSDQPNALDDRIQERTGLPYVPSTASSRDYTPSHQPTDAPEDRKPAAGVTRRKRNRSGSVDDDDDE